MIHASTIETLERCGVLSPPVSCHDVVTKVLQPDDDTIFGRQSRAMGRAVSRQYMRQLAQITNALVSLGFSPASVLFDTLSLDRLREWTQQMERVMGVQIGNVMSLRGQRAMRQVLRQSGRGRVATGISFDLQNQDVQRFLANESRIIGRHATDAFRDEIRERLQEGVSLGESPKQISQRIQEISSDFVPYKADRIARTETAYAFVEGNISGWEQSGVVQGKRFLLAPDACPFCQAVADMYGDGQSDEGRVFGLRESLFQYGDTIAAEFKQEDGTTSVRRMTFDYEGLAATGVQGPPIHPNCRCDLVPVV